MGMTIPVGEDAYLTAQAQFTWMKAELGIPEVLYGNMMWLMETWLMGVPASEVLPYTSLRCYDMPAISPLVVYMSSAHYM